MPEYLDAAAAAARLTAQAAEFVVLDNIGGQFPACDILPLAPKSARAGAPLAAVLVDMDGTTTTTEDLCLHALETALRRMTGWHGADAWSGLDPARDYPNIIGASATANVEYLAGLHAGAVDAAHTARAYVQAAAWTLARAPIPPRKTELRNNLHVLGLAFLLDEPRFNLLMDAAYLEREEERRIVDDLAARVVPRLDLARHDTLVRVALDLYYQRLHEHLALIDAGKGGEVALQAFGDASRPAITPLPGIGALMALAKGWLGADAAALYPELRAHLDAEGIACNAGPDDLGALGEAFERQPVQTGLVTSSALPEADIVLREVFRQLRMQAAGWPIPQARRDRIVTGLANPAAYYDVMVTATDCHEIRLKPHRDLYTVALGQLGIPAAARSRIVAFEDTEAGILALRGAGIGIPVAVPFHGTRGHNFSAASHACFGGLPEAILVHGLFV